MCSSIEYCLLSQQSIFNDYYNTKISIFFTKKGLMKRILM
ncbi:hypothetical protein SC09_Contig25orf00511 [Bacillus subtilis]|uniref:Uncharacterized protein n=1 Tax=Bacillus subtilis TaxID=1423 RepID=A0A0D1JE64_BACIU|nr:hypothetical protein SC09_Contig25orf00511 [Bacillus subtilis]